MPDSKIILPYRIYSKWLVGFLLLLTTTGTVGFALIGNFLYHGGSLGSNNHAILHGKFGAVILWILAAMGAFTTPMLLLCWLAIKRCRPCVVLEEDAITVPSKWRMQPMRIPLNEINSIAWNPKTIRRVGYVFLWHLGKKITIIENMLQDGDAQTIIDWISNHQKQTIQSYCAINP